MITSVGVSSTKHWKEIIISPLSVAKCGRSQSYFSIISGVPSFSSIERGSV